MKKVEYLVVHSEKGLSELCEKVSEHLTAGWKPVGGIAFNMGYPYQAIARVVENQEKQPKQEDKKPVTQGAVAAMRALNNLT